MRVWIDQLLPQDHAVIAMDDRNDSPGPDVFQDMYGNSSSKTVYDPAPTTSRFWNKPEKRCLQALPDFTFVSDDKRRLIANWCIWHPLDDPACWAAPGLRNAQVRARDHFFEPIDLAI